MKNPDISRDPITGMYNVEWGDGRTQVYTSQRALQEAGITIDGSGSTRPHRRYTRRGNVLHIHPIQHKTTTYSREIT